MKKSISFCVLILLLCNGCATHFGEKWNKGDTAREIVHETLLIVDWGQTKYIAKHPNQFYEKNPLLGRHPSQNKVDLYMGSALLLHPVISAYLKPEYRKWFQYITIGIETGCVINNASIGIKIGW